MRKYVVVTGQQRKQLLANVLADKDNRFAASLEILALKKQPTTKYLVILKKSLIDSNVRRTLKTKAKKETFVIRTEICKVTRLLIHQLIN